MLNRVLSALIAIVALTVSPGFAQNAAAPEHAPRIACDEPAYNFGDMENTRNVEHTFVIRNEGDLSLKIERVKPTCSCTVANISRNTIPPGETAEISTRLSLRGRRGRQRKAITVYSDDPSNPTFMLYLEGNAVTEVNVDPRNLFFGRISSDSVVTGKFEISVNSQNPVRITKLESRTEHLSVTNIVADEGRLYRIEVKTVPPLPQGTLRSSVRVETDHPNYAAMDIVVSAFVVGDITFAPPVLDIPVRADETITRYLLLRSESSPSFEITGVEAPMDSIQTTVQRTAPDAYRIEISNIPAVEEINGKTLKILTDINGGKDFEVPFRSMSTP